MIDVVIPAVGVAMTEALLVRWMKQPGEPVAKDEVLAEIETDKATMDLTSPGDGLLGKHLFEAGAVVPVGVAIARVLESDELEAADQPDAAPPSQRPTASIDEEAAASSLVKEANRKPHKLSPRARRLERERLTLNSSAEAGKPVHAAEPGRFRRLIAERTLESWQTIPHFAVTREIDATAMLAVLSEARRRIDPEVTLTDLMLRSLALAQHDAGHEGPLFIGFAVATEDGVVTTVIQDVLALDLAALARERRLAVERARSRRLTDGDLAVPVTTLSNLGASGIDHFTGIIATGQPTLLTVGRVRSRAVVDAGAVIAGTTFYATLNADHRSLDGADAARLLAAFAAATEDLERLMGEGTPTG